MPRAKFSTPYITKHITKKEEVPVGNLFLFGFL